MKLPRHSFSQIHPLFPYREPRRLITVGWTSLSLLVLVGDYVTGPFVQLPFLFFFPTALASWYAGLQWGYILAFTLPFVRIFFSVFWKVPWTMLEASGNAIIQMLVLAAFAFLIDQVAQKQQLSKEIRVLRGFLPICGFCKKIRNQDNIWESLETYITERSEAKFSHTVCQECAREHYGYLADRGDREPLDAL
jgi:hypothetical protein